MASGTSLHAQKMIVAHEGKSSEGERDLGSAPSTGSSQSATERRLLYNKMVASDFPEVIAGTQND